MYFLTAPALAESNIVGLVLSGGLGKILNKRSGDTLGYENKVFEECESPIHYFRRYDENTPTEPEEFSQRGT